MKNGIDAATRTKPRAVTVHVRQESVLMAKPEFQAWRRSVQALLAQAGLYLHEAGYDADGGACTVLLCDDSAITALNRDFRGKDRPTNVLSFPSDEKGYLGDIAIALPTCVREAEAQGKAIADHMAHLTLHGYLHLLGFDHMDDAGAEEMERLEAAILARQGIADPYILNQ